MRELVLNAGAGIYAKNTGDIIFHRLVEVYEPSDVLMKQRIARLFFPEKVIADANIFNMLPEFIKKIFGLELVKNRSMKEQDFNNDEMINNFLNEIALLPFEQQLKTN